jgi:hypothetical protein
LYREIREYWKRTVEFPEMSRVLRETSEVPGESHRVEEESCGVRRETCGVALAILSGAKK